MEVVAMPKRQKRDGKDRWAADEQKRQRIFFEAACLAIQADHLERVKELVAEGMDLSAIDNSTGAPLRFKEALFEYRMSRGSFKVLTGIAMLGEADNDLLRRVAPVRLKVGDVRDRRVERTGRYCLFNWPLPAGGFA
jgi:hypothetical protein